MTRRTKQQQLQGHLEAIQRLRKEIAEEERRAKRQQHEVLAKVLAELGLVETVLEFSKEERERIGELPSVKERFEALAKLCGQEAVITHQEKTVPEHI